VFDRLGGALYLAERTGIWHYVVSELGVVCSVEYTHSLVIGGLMHFHSVEGGHQKWRLINGI